MQTADNPNVNYIYIYIFFMAKKLLIFLESCQHFMKMNRVHLRVVKRVKKLQIESLIMSATKKETMMIELIILTREMMTNVPNLLEILTPPPT